MALSKIEWTDYTFNPWWGCEKVSPGCAHCYAEGVANHRAGKGLWGGGHGFRFFGDKHWAQPLRWNAKAAEEGKRFRVFCASMADVFEDRPELVPTRRRLFELIEATPELDWQILTKRPEYALTWWHLEYDFDEVPQPYPPNVWLGVSIENARYTWRADVLREIPAAVRFISAEPLLGSLYLSASELPDRPDPSLVSDPRDAEEMRRRLDAGSGRNRAPLDLSGIDWVIVGGESGPGARPFHLEHAREIVRACRTAGGWQCSRDHVTEPCNNCDGCRSDPMRDARPAVFVKQLGAKPVETYHVVDGSVHLLAGEHPLKLRDRKGGDWDEWPADLRIREFPRAAAA